jgi:hypothetical protein
MGEQGPQGMDNEEAWERFMKAERRELQMRREGHLAKILGPVLPDESPEELRRLAEEDRLRAEEDLVKLMDILTWPDVVSACVHRLGCPTPQDRPRSSLPRR